MAAKSSEMSFMQNVKKELNGSGCVYTVRKYKYKTNTCYVASVGYCYRELITEFEDLNGINKEILSSYTSKSGFKSVDEWIKMITHFVSGEFPVYLYKVTKGVSG